MDNKIKQCYQDLELDETASADDAKRAWRQLAKVWHPDRFPNDEKLQQRGQEKLKKINEAYELLSDYLANPPSPKPRSQPSQNHQQHAPQQPPKPSAESDFQQDSKLDLLKSTIKEDIEKKFVLNPTTRAACILSFNLAPTTVPYLYKGILVVSLNGKSETLTINVWNGGEHWQWEIERPSTEQPKQATQRQPNEYDESETILYAPCEFCGSSIEFPQSKTGDKVNCPTCGRLTFLPYGATVKRRGNPRVQKPFVNQNNPQANNAEEGSNVTVAVLAIIGFLLIGFGLIDLAGMFFHYDITGVSWSPNIAWVGVFLLNLADSTSKKNKGTK